MAQQPPTIEFEDVPLDEARRMSRGPRMARRTLSGAQAENPIAEHDG